jgi:predicted nucleic acid-binding protein
LFGGNCWPPQTTCAGCAGCLGDLQPLSPVTVNSTGAVKNHRLAFGDAMLWGAAQRAGVRHLFTEDLQDGFELAGVRFVNPFEV